MTSLPAWVALLRGVNVGGKNRLPMRDLAAAFTRAGCSEVLTYIQSGNVVFRAGASLAGRVPSVAARAVETGFGFRPAVLLRSAAELRSVARSNPFLRSGADPDALHVAFLSGRPEPAAVASLDPNRSPPDAFAVRGREVYLHCPRGFGRSKLGNDWLESKLGTASTIRNWRTVLALVDLLAVR